MAGLGLALHTEMRFDAEATTVNTPAAEAFAARHGVCQDFTHIMIIALRSLGIPSGYVSGYLRTLPPPGKERLEGGGRDACLGVRLVRPGNRMGGI